MKALVGTAALALAALSAAAVEAADLGVEDPWARASIGTSRPGAAYFTVTNAGAVGDVLLEVRAAISGKAEVHEMTMQDGVARMGPAGALAIPAGETLTLAPGGLHVMLMDLKAPLVEGEALPLTLVFETAGEVQVSAPILGLGARGPEQ